MNTQSQDTSTFRSKSEPKSEVLPKGKRPAQEHGGSEEVPYLDYEREHNHPYSVDYFELGDTWKDPKSGFPEEVSLIESYVESQINSGEIPNSVTAIKDMIKGMEKMNNLNKEERPVVKIEVLTAYIKFLMEKAEIKKSVSRYGNN